MQEFTFINEFAKRLISFSYPIDTIVFEYKIAQSPSQGMVDIAIIDKVTNEPLLIFEIKVLRERLSESQLKKQGEAQLLKYINGIGDLQIPAYLVIAKTLTDFEIFSFEADEKGVRELSSPVPMESIMRYEILSNRNRTSAIGVKKQEIKKTTDRFKIICWICAGIAAALAICDNVGIFTISTTQLALIGVAIALVIIPYSRKLKILGVEFERFIAEKNDKKSD